MSRRGAVERIELDLSLVSSVVFKRVLCEVDFPLTVVHFIISVSTTKAA